MDRLAPAAARKAPRSRHRRTRHSGALRAPPARRPVLPEFMECHRQESGAEYDDSHAGGSTMVVRGGKSEFRTFIALAGILGVMLTAPTARAQCTGDCNDSGNVSIDELVLGVNISLGTAELSRCEAFDCEGNQMVPV